MYRHITIHILLIVKLPMIAGYTVNPMLTTCLIEPHKRKQSPYSFYPFSQDEYLAIVAQWLSALGVSAAKIEAARPEALVWALERGSRSGRVAQQFARDYAGRHGG